METSKCVSKTFSFISDHYQGSVQCINGDVKTCLKEFFQCRRSDAAEQRAPTTSKALSSTPPRVKFGNQCGGEGNSLRLRRFPPGTLVSAYNAKLDSSSIVYNGQYNTLKLLTCSRYNIFFKSMFNWRRNNLFPRYVLLT